MHIRPHGVTEEACDKAELHHSVLNVAREERAVICSIGDNHKEYMTRLRLMRELTALAHAWLWTQVETMYGTEREQCGEADEE